MSDSLEAESQPVLADSATAEQPPVYSLSSVHTRSFPELLRLLGASIVVSTYQAGKLVFLRADTEGLNTHFRSFIRPMGIASGGGRLWLGTATEIWEFHNSSSIARSLEPADKHDACFLPRHVRFTGDIQVHEMSVAGGDLWFINTRFSCLCTLDDVHSFVPQWQPPFITDVSPEDRCHLNGLAMKDNLPAFVTALGTSNERRGWRENKRTGGVVISIADNDVVARGLCMPHSPRWHQGKLWVLESGTGSLGTVDLTRG
ncbi:MAG: TIGR03032 family protein, partial [Aureliella sp.]